MGRRMTENGDEYSDNDQLFSREELSKDAALEVLSNETRREILKILINSDEPTITLDKAASHLEDEFLNKEGEEGLIKLKVELSHQHIPMLREHGLVDYDFRTKEMRYYTCENLEELLGTLEKFPD